MPKTINDGFEYVAVELLRPHERNINQGDFGAIQESVQQNGFFGAIVAQKSTGKILAGNHRYHVAKQEGFDELPVVWVDVDDEAALRILLADNRTARLGTDNEAALAELLAELAGTEAGLAGTGFAEEDLQSLIDNLTNPLDLGAKGAPEAQVDRAEELRQKWGTERGQLWEVGRHRLLCGDSTSAEDVARLMQGERASCMWTDPPYGVSYVGKTKDALTIENDGAEGLPDLLRGFLSVATDVLEPGAPFYIAHPAGVLCLTFGNAIVQAGWRFHQTLIWVKDVFVLGHSDYHFQHEPIYYGWTPGEGRSGRGNHEGSRWRGDHAQVSTFHVPRPKRSEDHPTEKPVDLVSAMLKNSTRAGGLVYEPFTGSGTTLVACEQLGRIGYGMELTPGYVAVCLERLSEMSLTPRLLNP